MSDMREMTENEYREMRDDLSTQLDSETAWAKHYSDRADAFRAALEASNKLLTALQTAQSIDLDSLGRQISANWKLLEKQP